MADLTIQLKIDPQTGKRNVIISYHSDSDALPEEHEQEHRALVEKLVQRGLLKASELGAIVVEREQPTGQSGEVSTEQESEQREALKQGG